MNSKMIGAAIGVLMLGGTTLASAHGLDDLFRLLPHPELRVDQRDDHDHYDRWHREYRGMPHHDDYQWERERSSHYAPRFDGRGGNDRDDHSRFAWRDHDRDDHPRFESRGHDRDGR
jgi:hypothetical protein